MNAGRAVTALVVSGFVLAAACSSATDVVVPRLDPVPPGTVLLLDDLDNENGGEGAYNWTNFAHWRVIDGCVDLHGNGFVDVQAGNGLYIDLDGTCQKGGTLESREAYELSPGSYVLEFWLAGNNRIDTPDTVIVSLGSLFQEQFVVQRRQQFHLISRTINVPSATSEFLRFRNLGGDDHGALLDLIRLRKPE